MSEGAEILLDLFPNDLAMNTQVQSDPRQSQGDSALHGSGFKG